MIKKVKAKFGLLFAILIGVTSLFTTHTSVHASSNLAIEKTDYSYTGISSITGNTVSDNIWKLKMDGKYVFCIESGIYTDAGNGYIPENFNSSKKVLLSKIAYYGYTVTGKTDYDYAVTQVMIWEKLGDTYKSSNIPNYHIRKAQIMAQVNNHNTLPSWHNQQVDVIEGNSVTLTDTNGVFGSMQLASNPTGTQLEVTGNQLKISASAVSNDGMITYKKIPNNQIGASIVYKKPQQQTLVEFHLERNVEANVRVNVIHLGNLKIQKIDETTDKPLPNTKLKFEYGSTVKEIITDGNGIAQINDIPEGIVVTVTEITAPDGYFNKGEIKKITIEPKKTISVVMNNKPQQGLLSLKKTGKQINTVEKKETEYGELVDIKFDYQPLAGVTYEITAVEDIMIGSVMRAKAGEVVATVTTDESGELIDMPRLFLGKYQAVDKDAPHGYIIDPTPMPFEFTYQGQEIELTSTSLKQSNEFQKLKLVLHIK